MPIDQPCAGSSPATATSPPRLTANPPGRDSREQRGDGVGGIRLRRGAEVDAAFRGRRRRGAPETLRCMVCQCGTRGDAHLVEARRGRARRRGRRRSRSATSAEPTVGSTRPPVRRATLSAAWRYAANVGDTNASAGCPPGPLGQQADLGVGAEAAHGAVDLAQVPLRDLDGVGQHLGSGRRGRSSSCRWPRRWHSLRRRAGS